MDRKEVGKWGSSVACLSNVSSSSEAQKEFLGTSMSRIKALACLRQQQETQMNNIGCLLSHDNDDVWVVEIVR
jgi:hypothetical protein